LEAPIKMKAKPTELITVLSASFFAVLMFGQTTKAQTTIDVERITCEQFVTFNVADPNQIGLWLSGYFHGKRGDRIFSVQEFRQDLAALKSACLSPANAKLPVMEVSEKVFPRK
jgi:hypothetical protein